jgi:hypothetical protein
MKRFVWILLAAFCTAIAQVQPVEPLPLKQASCGCCEDGAGACGMRDCVPPPACPSACAGLVLASARATLRAEVESVMPKSRSFRDRFYAQFSPRQAVPAEIAPRVVAPTASVPVFKAHCSFLI